MSKRQRHQVGYIYEAADGFYVRYRVAGVQQSHFLTPKSPEYSIRRERGRNGKPDRLVPCTKLRQQRDAFMLTVNTPKRGDVRDMKIADFWNTHCLPYYTEARRGSTVDSYKQLWRQLLAPHFGERMLSEYRRADAQLFVESLTKKYGRRSILHIKNLASGIFERAVILEFITTNVWQLLDMKKILHHVAKPAETPHYTLPEFQTISSALAGHTAAQLAFMLAFFTALRPEEIFALKWGDFATGADGRTWVHVRRTVVRGRVDERTKTDESMRPVPMNRHLVELSARWQRESTDTSAGAWLFPNTKGKPAPVDAREMARRVIRPALRTQKLEHLWRGYYAGRRGGITATIDLTGNVVAGQELARHKNAATTTAFYLKHTPRSLQAGVDALEAAADESRNLNP